MIDSRASRIALSLAAVGVFYGALFTGHAPAPPPPAPSGDASGIATDLAKALVAEARALIDRGDYARALEPAQKLRDAFPSNPIYIEQLAVTYHHTNRPAEEAALWEEYLLISPTPGAACPHLGLAYRALGKQDDALDAFTRCLNLDPGDPDAILYLAIAEEREGHVDKAKELYQRGLALVPDYHDMRLGLARIDLREGRIAEAKSAALLVLKAAPENTDALFVAGLACTRAGESAQARAYLARGLALSPGNADLAEALAQVAAGEDR